MKYFFVFILLFHGQLYAQIRLAGTISDTQRIPLAYAAIELKNAQNKEPGTLQADSSGRFIFQNIRPGKYLATISYTGYARSVLHLFLSRDTTLQIILHPSDSLLHEVFVIAGKPVIEDNFEKTIYHVSTSIAAKGSDALTAIGGIPGVRISGDGISLAGKGAVRVMINDRIVQLAGTDLTRFLKSVTASRISKIELIKNPAAQYDAEGNGGLINIITKQDAGHGFSGDIQFSDRRWMHRPARVYGTTNYWMADASLNLNYHAGKWSAYASVNTDQDHELEGFETDVFYPEQTWLQTDTGDYRYHNFSVMAGADYKINSKTSIGASYLGGRTVYIGSDHVNNPVYNHNGALDSTLRTYATYYPVARPNSVNVHVIFNFDTSGKKLLLNADYFDYYRTDRSDFETNSYLPGGEEVPAGNTRYHDTNKEDIKIYTVKADAEIPTRFARLSFGGKLSFIDNYSNAFYYDKGSNDELTYNTALSNEFKYNENTQSLYVSIANEKNKWKYQAGLRAEYTETKGYSFTLDQTTIHNYLRLFPSLSVSYQLNPDNSFALGLGRRINRPSFWNLNPFKSLFTAYSYGEGNPYLQPENISNVEVSHRYKNRLSSSLFLNITDNGFNNLTVASADTSLVYTIPLNFIKIIRVGITENFSIRLFPWIDNSNQMSVYHISARSSIPFVENIKGYGMYLSTHNTVYLNSAKTFAAFMNFWYQFPEVDHIGRADAYSKLDFGFSAKALQDKMDISMNLNDAFQSSASAVTGTVNGIRTKFSNFQINRYVQLSISYRFGQESGAGKRDTGNEEERGRVQ